MPWVRIRARTWVFSVAAVNVKEVISLVILICGAAAMVIGLIRGDAATVAIGAGFLGGPGITNMFNNQ